MSFYDELKQPNEDLKILASLIQAVHKSSDLEEIYRVALDSVMDLENVDLAMIYLVDEEKREAVLKAHRNVTEDYIRRAERIPYPKGITWKAINSGRVINIEDAQKDPDTGPAGRDLGHHSNLSIPIIMEGKVIGVIWFGSYKERRFDEREVNLLSTLGNQIAIAIAKAKRTEELEQAQKKLKERNRNLSILSAISQAVHQSADLNQIYRTLLDVTEDLKFIDLISLYLVEGVGDKREAVIQIHRGYPQEYLKKASRIPYPKGNVWKVIESGKSVFYEDASDSSTPVGPAGKALGQRSLLSIPIKSGSEIIGTIDFSSFTKRRFSNQELDFLLSLGNQIGTAIAKAKMFGEIKQREEALRESFVQLSKKNRYETIISTVTRSVHQSINLQDVLENAVEAMNKNIDKVNVVSVYLVEEEEAVLKAHRGFTTSYIERAGRIPYPKGLTWKTIIDGKPRYCADADQDTILGPAGREMGIKSYLSMPIFFEEESVGCLNISSLQENAFDEEELKLLEIAAQQIEVAINNAQRANALRQSEERYRAIVEDQTELICRFLPHGTLTFVNESYCRYFAKKREELVGQSFMPLIPDEDQETRKNHLASLSWENPVATIEHRVLMPSREVRWQQWTDRAVSNQEGNIVEFQSVGRDITERKRIEEVLREKESRLEKQQKALLELAKINTISDGGLKTALQKITEASSRTLGVERVSVWLYKDNRSKIVSFDMYEQSLGRHSEGIELSVDEAPNYFKAMEEKDCIVAHDARRDQSTKEFSDSYLTPFGITSMLDAPIRLGGQTVGVICHEHVGPVRQWSVEEQSFVCAIADIVSLTKEQWERRRAEEALLRRSRQLEILSRVNQEINTVLEIPIVMRTLIASAMELVEAEAGMSGLMVNGKMIFTEYNKKGELITIDYTFEQGYGIPGWVMSTKKPYICNDAENDPHVISEIRQSLCFYNFINVPILNRRGELLGCFEVLNKRGHRRFDEGEIEILRGLAASVAIALENAQMLVERKRAEEALRESLVQLSKKNRYEYIVSTVTRSVHRSINLQEVLENAVEAMSENIDRAENVSIYMVEREEAVLRAYRGYPDWFIEQARRIPYLGGFTWKTIIEGKPVYCADVDEDTAIGAAGRKMGTKSYASMPIHFEGKTVGVININSLEKNAFDEEELKLLEIVAQQIQVAISNAKQAEKLRALYENLNKRNRDLEILNSITQAVHQSLNLQEVYRIALDKVIELENVDIACTYLVDETKNEALLQDYRNLPEEFIQRAERIPYPKGATWKVINTGKVLNVRNAQEDPDIGPAGRDLEFRGMLGIPITLEGKTIGVIWLLSYREYLFTKSEEDLLISIGTQIAIAIAKANLYRELSKKNRYETIISTVTRSVHQSITLQDVLENAVESMSKNIEAVDTVAIYMAEGEEAVLKAHRDFTTSYIKRAGRIPYPRGLTWETIIEGKPRYCADVEQDTVIGPAGRDEGIKSYLSMPISFERKTLGCINISSFRKNAFDEEELKLLEIVAQQIEVAINNAKQMEALKKSEEQQALILRSVPVATYICQTFGNFNATWMSENIEHIAGYPAKRFVDQEQLWVSRIHRDDRQRVLTEFGTMLDKGSIAIEYRWQCADGSYHWFLDQAVLVGDEQGKPKEIIGTWLDITDRKQAEQEVHTLNLQLEERVNERTAQLKAANEELLTAMEEADRANRAKSEFLSRMSHELRTPMNAILGFAQLLEMYPSITPERRENVKHILEAGRHLLNLINEVLDITRIDSGRLTVSMEQVRVKDVTEEALDLIQPIAEQRKIRLQSILVNDWYILADRRRVKQVLLNLLSNAVKYNREGGLVDLSCEEVPEKLLRIKVSDTGSGIPLEKMARLFNPFDRLGAEQSSIEGTGLGLALCKQLVGAMRGIIGVESTAGQGSTFWIEMPLIEPPVEQFNRLDVSSKVELEPDGKGRTVLYIEDDLSSLRLIEQILAHRPGIKVLSALQGSLGLDLAHENDPDLILLDLNLPDLSGEEVLCRLKEDPKTREIPVAIISANGVPGNVEKFLTLGVQAYLTKPLDVEEFLNALDNVL